MLQEAWHYRQTNSSLYQPTNEAAELNVELVPWTGMLAPHVVTGHLYKPLFLITALLLSFSHRGTQWSKDAALKAGE